MTRRKIVAISGSGRTGSTLLSVLLSQDKSIFNLGQLRDLWTAWAANARCSCGHRLGDCPVYSVVIREAFGEPPDAQLQQMRGQMKAFFHDAARLRLSLDSTRGLRSDGRLRSCPQVASLSATRSLSANDSGAG